jgi:hypothetical protein
VTSCRMMPRNVEELKSTAVAQAEERLPPNAKILLLSLTGSRAFGWAAENFDYDVHGIYACRDYWDWVHLGKDGIDLNLYELEHIFWDVHYQHFEVFQNLSNPIYVHPGFDFAGLMDLCTPRACDEFSIRSQYRWLELQPNPRTALHSYRIVMVQLYWLENRRFELDVFKLNDIYRCEMLPLCRDAYAYGKNVEIDYAKVKEELGRLLDEFRKAKAKCASEGLDEEKFSRWKEGVSRLWR